MDKMSLKVIKEFCAAVVDSLMKQKEWTYTKNPYLCKSKNDNSTVVLLLGPNLVDNVNKVAIKMHFIVTKYCSNCWVHSEFYVCLYFLE